MPFHKHATDFSQRILGHTVCRTFKTLKNRVAQRNDVCFIFYKGLDLSDDKFFVLFEISIIQIIAYRTKTTQLTGKTSMRKWMITTEVHNFGSIFLTVSISL